MWRNKLYNKRIVLLNNVFFCEESKVSLLQSFLNDFRCSADTAFEFLPSIILHLVQLFRNSRKLSLGFKVCLTVYGQFFPVKLGDENSNLSKLHLTGT